MTYKGSISSMKMSNIVEIARVVASSMDDLNCVDNLELRNVVVNLLRELKAISNILCNTGISDITRSDIENRLRSISKYTYRVESIHSNNIVPVRYLINIIAIISIATDFNVVLFLVVGLIISYLLNQSLCKVESINSKLHKLIEISIKEIHIINTPSDPITSTEINTYLTMATDSLH